MLRKEFVSISNLYKDFKNSGNSDNNIAVQGWVKTNRNNGKIGFIQLNDGTYFKDCQVVYENNNDDEFDKLSKLSTGCSIEVRGVYVETPESKQPFEIKAKTITVTGYCDSDYPIQKKGIKLETLREIPHLRVRTNTFLAQFKVRSVLSQSIHKFFQEKGFIYVTAPLITGNDAEGGSESFTVTTRTDGKYEEDFFGKHSCLTVSGQLHVEPFALAFSNVYTFGPTFRAENSNTTTHASEFWMIEPEMANADLFDDMNLIEEMMKYCIKFVLDNCEPEMQFFNNFMDKEHKLIERMQNVVNSEFKFFEYKEAIEILKKADKKFEYPVDYGIDLKTEHERYLCEEVVKGPVFIINYPKDIKAFYMRLNDDGETVAACDLLVPGVGELVGGSQREERYDMLIKRMEEMNINVDELQWYADLRRFGTVKHSGFGIGLERLLLYITNIGNIRDTIPYPRTPRNMIF